MIIKLKWFEYSNDLNGIDKNIEEYNANKKCKTVIGFGDVIADMFSNEKLYLIVTEFF